MAAARMHRIVNDEALDLLFRRANQPERWLDRPVGDTLLRAVSELVSLAPIDSGPRLRLAFIKSTAAKARLAAAVPVAEGMLHEAPVVAIVAQSREGESAGSEPEPEAGRLRLAAASLIFAARALGLDCRPITAVDGGAIEAAFFPDGAATEFLCAIGYGADPGRLPAAPRNARRETCQIF